MRKDSKIGPFKLRKSPPVRLVEMPLQRTCFRTDLNARRVSRQSTDRAAGCMLAGSNASDQQADICMCQERSACCCSPAPFYNYSRSVEPPHLVRQQLHQMTMYICTCAWPDGVPSRILAAARTMRFCSGSPAQGDLGGASSLSLFAESETYVDSLRSK